MPVPIDRGGKASTGRIGGGGGAASVAGPGDSQLIFFLSAWAKDSLGEATGARGGSRGALAEGTGSAPGDQAAAAALSPEWDRAGTGGMAWGLASDACRLSTSEEIPGTPVARRGTSGCADKAAGGGTTEAD